MQRPRLQKRAAPEQGTRCPFCHESVGRGGLGCPACSAPHHKVCLLEANQTCCATCGHGLQAELERALPTSSRANQRATSFSLPTSPGVQLVLIVCAAFLAIPAFGLALLGVVTLFQILRELVV
jgi:hypothetical protein